MGSNVDVESLDDRVFSETLTLPGRSLIGQVCSEGAKSHRKQSIDVAEGYSAKRGATLQPGLASIDKGRAVEVVSHLLSVANVARLTRTAEGRAVLAEKLHLPDDCVTDSGKQQPNLIVSDSITLDRGKVLAYTPIQIAPWDRLGALEIQCDGWVLAATESL